MDLLHRATVTGDPASVRPRPHSEPAAALPVALERTCGPPQPASLRLLCGPHVLCQPLHSGQSVAFHPQHWASPHLVLVTAD